MLMAVYLGNQCHMVVIIVYCYDILRLRYRDNVYSYNDKQRVLMVITCIFIMIKTCLIMVIRCLVIMRIKRALLILWL